MAYINVVDKAEEMEMIISRGVKEVQAMKYIDVARTSDGLRLRDKYVTLYNSLMESAEQVGLNPKLIIETINALQEYDRYDAGIRIRLNCI